MIVATIFYPRKDGVPSGIFDPMALSKPRQQMTRHHSGRATTAVWSLSEVSPRRFSSAFVLFQHIVFGSFSGCKIWEKHRISDTKALEAYQSIVFHPEW